MCVSHPPPQTAGKDSEFNSMKERKKEEEEEDDDDGE